MSSLKQDKKTNSVKRITRNATTSSQRSLRILAGISIKEQNDIQKQINLKNVKEFK